MPFWIFFFLFNWNYSLFHSQREVPEPLEPSPGYATDFSKGLDLPLSYTYTVYLFLRDAKLFLRDSINLSYLYKKISVPPSERSDAKLPHEGFHLQVPHKYSVPPSEGYQNPSEEFHLQVKTKHLLLRDANLPLRDSMFVIRRCLFPYALIIERFLIFKEQIKRSLK